MNAPTVKQITRLGTIKNWSPKVLTICTIKPVVFETSTIAAQMLKPIMDAPTKMNVALRVVGILEGVTRM